MIKKDESGYVKSQDLYERFKIDSRDLKEMRENGLEFINLGGKAAHKFRYKISEVESFMKENAKKSLGKN